MAEIATAHMIHVQESGEFFYGKARARFGEIASFNSAARKMAGRIERLGKAVGIPLEIGSRAIHHDTEAAFIETTIAGKSFFLMARNPMDERSIESIVQGKTPDISLISGPCLFGGDVATAVGQSGRTFSLVDPEDPITEPIESLDFDADLSLYEIDAIKRSGGILSALVASTPHIKRVALNIPQVEYYSYPLAAYEAGYISSEQLLEWCHAVDKRHARLFSSLERRILRKLDVDRNLGVIDFMPLDPVREYFMYSIANEEIPHLAEACGVLAESSDLWREILAVASPETWQDLDYLSYVYAELSTAEVRGKRKTPHIAIAVESPVEVRIFGQAKKIASQLTERTFNLIGLYPHEHVVEREATGRTFYYASAHPSRRGDAIRDILRAY